MEHQDLTTATVLSALALSAFAGLSTGIGSLMAFFAKKADERLLTLAMGFSAGVMIYVSFAELYPDATHALREVHGEKGGSWLAVASFFGGMLLIAGIDKLIPAPHEFAEENGGPPSDPRARLMRVGIFTAFALALHNFPEGIATFVGALKDPKLGTAVAIAVAIHNIPEGIAVSFPVFYATGSRKRAFWYSFSSGVAEPIGALVAFLLLMPFLSATLFGVLFASVAGIMVFISLDQLLPAAERYGQHHLSIYGLVFGMGVMALSLLLLR
jgi:ZIP family zinc transporter